MQRIKNALGTVGGDITGRYRFLIDFTNSNESWIQL